MKVTHILLRLLIAAAVIGSYYFFNLRYPIVGNILYHLVFFACMFFITLLLFRQAWKNLGYGFLIGMFIAVGAAIIYVFTLLLNKL